MKKCDKTSADPKRHTGPFGKVSYDIRPEGAIAIASCAGCGNAVFRPLKPGEEGKARNENLSK